MNKPTKILIVSAIIALLGVGVWSGVQGQRSSSQNTVPRVMIASLGAPAENWLSAYPGAMRADGWMLLEYSKIVAVMYPASGKTLDKFVEGFQNRMNGTVDFSQISKIEMAEKPAIQFTGSTDVKTVYTMFSHGEYVVSVELSNAEPKVTYEDGTENQEEMTRARETNRATYDSALRSLVVR